MLSSNYWFRPSLPFYSIGVVVYVALLIVFAYFYTSISFNPLEIADNMKKSGGFIPGVRPGKPTSDFLNNMLNHLIIIIASDHFEWYIQYYKTFLHGNFFDHYCKCCFRDGKIN